MMDMNSSKLESPIILVDPTYKQRNALATLSKDVFEKFRNLCREFLKSPNINFFRMKEIDFKNIEILARKKGHDFILLQISTDKQEGAVAGSKLLKFYNHIEDSIKKYFDVKEKGFYYHNKKSAECFFVVHKKDKIIIKGPPITMKELEKFKKRHKNTLVKSGIVYAEEKINFDIKQFINQWQRDNKKIIKDMYISDVRIF
jgi:tRNA nucleotidyltransferase (CCA-adding enzyme)